MQHSASEVVSETASEATTVDADLFSSATALARAIRQGVLSSVEAAQRYLDRADRANGALNALIWRDDEALLAAAERADRQLRSGDAPGPFHGVPIPIKDLSNAAGQPNTSGGSRAMGDAPKQTNDLIVKRFLDAGFLLGGRSNSPEAGMIQVTENQRYGITRNPWNLDRTPGGSSGGAAALVAAGIAPVAHASDGGGSIRMPASCTGLVGLKPSRSRVPAALPSWENCTTGGVVTRTVKDAARLLDVISVEDALGWYRAPRPERPFAEEVGGEVPKLRIGLLTSAPNGVPVDPDCVQATERIARLLESDGHEIVPVEPGIIGAAISEIYLFTVIETALHTMEWERPELAEPYIVHRMRRAAERGAGDYVRAVRDMQLESRRVVAHWGRDFDLLLTPTLATRVPEAGVMLEQANTILDGTNEREAQMMAFMVPANVTGLPAISVPAGYDRDGLPLGAHLMGAPFGEAALIRVASRLEASLRWDLEHPGLYVGEPR